MEVKVLVVLPQPAFIWIRNAVKKQARAHERKCFLLDLPITPEHFNFLCIFRQNPSSLKSQHERFHWPCDGNAKRRFEWIATWWLGAHPFRWTTRVTRAWNFHAMLLESKRRECRALLPIGWQKSNSQQHNCTAIVGVNRRSFWVPSLNIWLSKVVTQKQSNSASTKHLKK